MDDINTYVRRNLNTWLKLNSFVDSYFTQIGIIPLLLAFVGVWYRNVMITIGLMMVALLCLLPSIGSHFIIERKSKYFFIVDDKSETIVDYVKIIDFNEEEWDIKLVSKD